MEIPRGSREELRVLTYMDDLNILCRVKWSIENMLQHTQVYGAATEAKLSMAKSTFLSLGKLGDLSSLGEARQGAEVLTRGFQPVTDPPTPASSSYCMMRSGPAGCQHLDGRHFPRCLGLESGLFHKLLLKASCIFVLGFSTPKASKRLTNTETHRTTITSGEKAQQMLYGPRDS
ncbi:hypothetical protein Y1Q_0002951 [Alligator mississippiensis]|uniref:Reverse transcriptase domain-containing protein n=1 Tax=Alligator mississippiensis TaxID=8496 RepID=A0A151MCZ4_ALLMI|nr:hypothetical protein Y1Q_0002951 [Alligator mississippiensis]